MVAQSDVTAALFATQRAAGRTPAMNAICAEIALRLECAMLTVRAEHYRGTLNFECDALSRLSQGALVPERLRSVRRDLPKPRSASFFWAWPRALLERR